MLETQSLPVELWSCSTWRAGKGRNLEDQIQCSTYGAEECANMGAGVYEAHCEINKPAQAHVAKEGG